MYSENNPPNIKRRLTASLRLLPDFLVIGAQKSGTTSLYQDLTHHPCIERSVEKEVHYFDWSENFKRGIWWYRSHFPLKIHKYYSEIVQKSMLVTGEASPDYLFYPYAPKRVAQILPDVKIIVILRNPVDRAYSHYHHEFSGGNEILSFEEAIRLRDKELEPEIRKMNQDESYCSSTFQRHSYLSRGVYWKQLEHWFQFFPREQFLIICSESYFRDPIQEYQKITRFLGLPDHTLKRYRKAHIGKYKNNMSKDMMSYLKKFYKNHNEKLYECLGTSFTW